MLLHSLGISLTTPVSCDYFLSVCYDGSHMETCLQETWYGDRKPGSQGWVEVCNAKEVKRRE